MTVFTRFLPRTLKDGARAGLARLGYGLHALDPHLRRHHSASFDGRRLLPPGAKEILRADNPRLLELKRRYSGIESSMIRHSIWNDSYLAQELSLEHFRGDNAYVWQFRNTKGDEQRKYYLFARYLAERDSRGLLRRLSEDGLFGCWTFEYQKLPLISRDLLDSINEMYFLDRHCGLFERPDFSVLDIGAGYGRLAHRMIEATGVRHYYCVDAIPQSTFLCEYYLGFRGCGEKAVIVPLDELEQKLSGASIDFAVNIHSFSEMPYAAIEGWLRLVSRMGIPRLLIVPNPAEGLMSYEADRTQRDFLPLLNELGYRLAIREPIIEDPDIRSLVGIEDHFFLLVRE